MFSKIPDSIRATVLCIFLFGCIGPGWLFWVGIAVETHNRWMLAVAIAGPLAIVAAVLGWWSLIFGFPAWLTHLMAP